MTMIIRDRHLSQRIRQERKNARTEDHDEVWDGVYIVSPLADLVHQRIVTMLSGAILSVIDVDAGDNVFAGANVSDREEQWVENFRVPDVAVVLHGNPAEDRGSHLKGGPDLVVEVVSEDDLSREKFDFYASIGVRELWIVDRYPWTVEVHRLEGGAFVLDGTSREGSAEWVASRVVPLRLRVVAGKSRPMIEVEGTDGAQGWSI